MRTQGEVRRRRRRVLSCLECRRRKIKCNREQPCNNCSETQQQCGYQELPWHHHQPPGQQSPARSRAPKAADSSWKSLVLTNGENTAAAAGPGISDTGRASAIPTPAASHGTGASHPTPDIHVSPGSGYLQAASGPSSTPAPVPVPPGPCSESRDTGNGFPRKLGAHGTDIVLDKTRILRWSHWISAGREFGEIFSCYMEIIDSKQESNLPREVKDILGDASGILQACKRLARSSKMWRPSRLFGMQGYDLMPPGRDTADAMAREYFRNFEPTMRVLHIPTFWKHYEDFWANQATAKIETRLIILLVVAIGSSVQDRSNPALSYPSISQVHQWIYAAQTWLSGPLEKDRTELAGLQVYCLVIIARQIYSVGGDLVWMSLGSLLHRAMQLGLHYDPSHFQGMSVLVSELRRRVWYTILELLVQASLDTAMPPRIREDEFDTQLPSNVDDVDLYKSTLEPKPDSQHTDTFLYLQLLSSLPVRLPIVRHLNSIKPDLSYSEAMRHSQALNAAHRQATQTIQANMDKSCPFGRNMVDFLVRRFIIPLHSPFACEARTNPSYHYSLKACTEAGLALISPEPDVRFSRLLELAGGLFREGLRSASTAICLDLIVQTRTQSADGTLHRAKAFRNASRQSVQDMLELCNRRIFQGETNVKSYLFLSMVLAMVDAMEQGIAQDMKIAESARDSLNHCYSVLESSIGPFATNTPSETSLPAMGREQGHFSGMDFGMDVGMDGFFSDFGFS